MTPKERAEILYREAKYLEEEAYAETRGVIRRDPRAWLRVADAHRVAADAALEAGGREIVHSLNVRADDIEQLVSEAFRPELSPQLSTLRGIAAIDALLGGRPRRRTRQRRR